MRSIAELLVERRRLLEANTLNRLLFDNDNILLPAIKSKIIEIVDKFIEYTQVDIKTMDIRLVGSNAAYNYTEDSDLDIHIVTDLSQISDPESIARLYFDSVKKNFKDAYDITIKGIEVELYIEDINSSAVSNGIYSVSKEKWIKEPAIIDDPGEDVMSQVEDTVQEIIDNIERADTTEDLQTIVDDLYLLRKDSLATDGETGVGNLVFKSIRNKGILDKVKAILRNATTRELSLENLHIRDKE